MRSILHKVRRADVVAEPFPHVVVDDALEPEVYARLMATFPSAEAIVDGRPVASNAAYRMPAARLLADSRVDDCWKEFVRQHTSRAFLDEVLEVFPTLGAPALDAAAPIATAVRNLGTADVLLDCQPCWGAPVDVASSSDPCHVDRPVTLFAGLLYCRLDGDDTAGGDLELFRFRGPERRFDATRHVDAALVEPVRRIGYAANRLVFFLQSPRALHGVTVRSATKWPRLHVNFLAEMQHDVWQLEAA